MKKRSKINRTSRTSAKRRIRKNPHPTLASELIGQLVTARVRTTYDLWVTGFLQKNNPDQTGLRGNFQVKAIDGHAGFDQKDIAAIRETNEGFLIVLKGD